MGLPSVSRIGASPLWRAGLAIVFILGLAGFAAGVIPQACRSGAVVCDGSLATQVDAAPVTPVDAAPTPQDGGEALVADRPSPASPSEALSPQGGEGMSTAASKPVVVTAMLEQPPATLTSNDLVARTFAALDAGLVTATGELTSRKVKTVTVGADGQPVGADAEGPKVAPLTPAEPAEVAAAPAQEEEPAPEPPAAAPEQSSSEPVQVAEAEPAGDEVSAVAYAPVREGNAVVKGSGVNVRSAPKKGANEVLFTLAGGEEVTVVEMSKGWAKIVDSRGRSGWAYGEYLRR